MRANTAPGKQCWLRDRTVWQGMSGMWPQPQVAEDLLDDVGLINTRDLCGAPHKLPSAYPVDSADPYMLWLRSTGGLRPWPDLIFRALWLSSKAVSRPMTTAGAISSTAAGPMDISVRDVVMRRRTS